MTPGTAVPVLTLPFNEDLLWDLPKSILENTHPWCPKCDQNRGDCCNHTFPGQLPPLATKDLYHDNQPTKANPVFSLARGRMCIVRVSLRECIKLVGSAPHGDCLISAGIY
jgi:hypothetical protein